MIRVLHVIDSLDLGGAQTALLEFLRFTDTSRFQCEVATMHGPGVFYEAFCKAAHRVYVLSPKKWLPLYVPRLFWLLKAGRYDVAHFHLFGANWIGKPIAGLAGVPIRFNHDQCNDAFRSQQGLSIKIDKLTNRFSTRILAVSHSTQKFLLEKEGIPSSKIHYLPNSVDTQFFQPSSLEDKRVARKKWDIPLEAIVVAGMGRLHSQKNFRLFLEIATAFQNQPNVIFLLAGNGPEEVALKSYAKELGLQDRIRFLGFIQDTKSLYAIIDILLLTSRYEGLPMVLLEAMASGCTFIGSRIDGVQEVVREGVDGLLADPTNKEEFIKHLQAVIADPSLRERFSTAARERVVAAFDSRGITRQLEGFYDSALKDCKAHDSFAN